MSSFQGMLILERKSFFLPYLQLFLPQTIKAYTSYLETSIKAILYKSLIY